MASPIEDLPILRYLLRYRRHSNYVFIKKIADTRTANILYLNFIEFKSFGYKV